MMKKLLVLMLVLGLSSAVNAALLDPQLWVAGPYSNSGYVPVQADYRDATDVTLVPCEYLWVGVYNWKQGTVADSRKDNFMLGTVEPTPDTSWTGSYKMYAGVAGNNGNDGLHPGLGEPLVDSCPVNEYYGVNDFGGGLVLDTWYLQLTEALPNAGTFNDIGVLDAKQLHCDQAFSIDVVGIYNPTTLARLDKVTIHQVPEPATLVLLGLGGFFLHRRKK
jgi:hypothetical protein